MTKVGVISGSRADYGLLRPLLERMNADEEVSLQLFVTGTHLSDEFGKTVEEIKQDGFFITEMIPIPVGAVLAVEICTSLGKAVEKYGIAYAKWKPDLIVVLGDRYEIFAAAIAALFSKIPIVHIHGGELTFGAYDDSMRHAITKMSCLHFTSTEIYRKRVIQMGEQPDTVFHVGALGIERLKKMNLYDKKNLETLFALSLEHPFFLVTYHPATLSLLSPKEQIETLFDALDLFPQYFLIFTKANADTGGILINHKVDEYVEKHRENAKAFCSLGSRQYLSLMRQAAIVIGNSSSGIIEAPSLQIPSIDIGKRQSGRIRAKSVFHCKNTKQDIVEAIHLVLQQQWEENMFENPYEKADTSYQILQDIKKAYNRGISIQKIFHDNI